MPTTDEIREALKEVYDPEIPINIVDLGLVYDIQQPREGEVCVRFTLTNPACPVGDQLAANISEAAGRLDGVRSVEVEIVWDPPWSKEKMSFDGKLQASMMGFG